MKKLFFLLVLILLSVLLIGCSDEDYPTTYVINKTVEHSNVIVTLDRVKEDMNPRDKISSVEFTIKNNLNDTIKVPLSYHFIDNKNNSRNLVGYGSDEAKVYLAGTEAKYDPFEIPANKEAKLSMDYEGFVKAFEWKLDVAINNKIETFSFKIALD